ncbi:MAG: hypothetical protein PHE50_04765 [Dehalococcoidales bacterium]|nr:hypothetical protein [Dehalococcoidales bacterium]
MKKTNKEKQPIKCSKCNIEFSDTELAEKHTHKAFVWHGKVFCESCLTMMGSPQEAQAWTAFSATQDSKMHDQSY